MPLQNRVQPDGQILAHPARGLFMGNRGILHGPDQQLTHARWRHKAWVCCVTKFKSRKRPLMTRGAYTELFFHDESVALAAGHRPCCECRRADYQSFLAAADHQGPIAAFDTKLHAARAIPRRFEQRRHTAMADTLPDGSFIFVDGVASLLWQGAAHPFSASGYLQQQKPPQGTVTVLTPEPTLRALRNGYRPRVLIDDTSA